MAAQFVLLVIFILSSRELILHTQSQTNTSYATAVRESRNCTRSCPEANAKAETEAKTSQEGQVNQSQTFLVAGLSLALFGFAALLTTSYVVQRREIRRLRLRVRTLTIGDVCESTIGEHSCKDFGDNNPILVRSSLFCHPFEIPRERLEIEDSSLLGSGEFSQVYKGVIKGAARDNGEDVAVAVRTLHPTADVNMFRAHLNELKIMSDLGSHENIVAILGAVTANITVRELFVALELCAKGDLLNFIKTNKADFEDLFKTKDEKPAGGTLSRRPSLFKSNTTTVNSITSKYTEVDLNRGELEKFTTADLLEWSRQVSSGMEYASSKNIIHGDLSASHILLTADNVAKISDFGILRELIDYSTCIKKQFTPLPWRWLAVESLLTMTFSVQSDMWAFGVLMYELFSLGAVPYPGFTWNHEFIDRLNSGYRLSCPQHGNQEIYNLMLECMMKEPTERISFPEMSKKLVELKAKFFPGVTYVSLN